MTTTGTPRKTRLGAALFLTALALTVQAGPLEPPVPPGNPTMKPIDQVEPRIPIHAGVLPLTIDQPGSYYLAEDIETTGGGIIVNTPDVTIDLNGYRLEGGIGPGIDAFNATNVTVRNGSVIGWSGTGVSVGNASAISDLTARLNTGSGIATGTDSRVVRCTAYENGGHGIIVLAGSIVRNSIAGSNSENGIWAQLPMGIMVSAQITGCVADHNVKNGIRVDGRAIVRDNLCRANDYSTTQGKAGIWVNGDANRVENNHLVDNNIGLEVSGDYNFIGGNTMRGNVTQNWHKSATATGNLFPIWTVASPDLPGRWDNIDQ